MSKIEKHFPADVSTEYKTFLNDNKIDGFLYAYLQTFSYPQKIGQTEDGKQIHETRVAKKSLPKQSEICKKIKVKSPKTYRSHLNYLIQEGYVIDHDDYYILPWIGHIFFSIPLDTLFYFRDILKEDVIKVFIYLGQRYKWKQTTGELYSFTRTEIAQHLGLCPNTDNLDFVDRVLTALCNEGFIDYVGYWDGKTKKLRLTKFSLNYRKKIVKYEGKNTSQGKISRS